MGDHASTYGGDYFHMDVERESDGYPVVVTVAGDVDLHSGPELRDRLAAVIDDDVRHVTIDLTHATFLDSMALGVLLGAKKRLAATGGDLGLVVSNPDLLRIFEITMLDRVFEIRPTRSQAATTDGLEG
ncbi:MAG TPA: STAS domain-containing protein [Gaiellaceae bacterium]|nr:STAS domain-containing protein [Gaiellaceae bacterium]